MIKNLHLLSICLSLIYTVTINGQVTITAADFNVVTQDTISYSVIDTTGVLFPAGGQNQSWDYSNIMSQGTYVQGFGPDVASSPGSSLFPGSNVLIGSSSRDQFQKWDTTKTEWTAVYYLNTQPRYDVYTNPRTQCQFPFTYGDTFTDSSVANLVRPNTTFVQKSLISSEIIGYGELTVPGAYYPDVLLNKYIWDGLTTSSTGDTNDFVNTTYFFWAPGYYFPVLFFEDYSQVLNGTASNSKTIVMLEGVTYMDLDELKGLQSNRLNVFPNPASDVVNVAGLQSQANYSVIAANGAILQKGILKTGENSLNIANLPLGNYLLLVEEDGVQSVQKFVKQ